jgi:DNA polymerase-4
MILCMDMDAFFASVEQASNPSLRGKPIAIVGAKERTVVVTASYEARKYGIKAGMSKYEALKACPFLTIVTGRNRKYTYVSSEITKFLFGITPHVEPYSIDEAFLDLSGTGIKPDDAAYMIKSFVKKNFGITCSVGGGCNKFIAKMASGVKKPDGYLLVEKDKTLEFIDTFQLKDFWGIGRKLSKRFADIGVFTPADLRALGLERLTQMFGVNGAYLYGLACGEYTSPVKTEEDAMKSIGHSLTLPYNIYTRDAAANYMLQLSDMVSARARKHRYSGKNISVTIRHPDMGTFSKSHTIPFFTSATHHIYAEAMQIFDQLWNGEEIRLLGVSLSSLVADCVTLTNIEDGTRNWEGLYSAMDELNAKYGDRALQFGSVLGCSRKGSSVISPAWRPTGGRNINIGDAD